MKNSYFELQIKINPQMEDIVSDICFENFPKPFFQLQKQEDNLNDSAGKKFSCRKCSLRGNLFFLQYWKMKRFLSVHPKRKGNFFRQFYNKI